MANRLVPAFCEGLPVSGCDASGRRALLDKGNHFIPPTADIWLLTDGARAMMGQLRG